MQKKQIMIIVLPILAVSLAAIPVVRFVKNEQRKVTAEEWIVNQYHLVGEFNLFASTLDDVVSVYTIGSMDVTDLANEVAISQAELAIMKRVYDQELEEHPIKTGTHTMVTKAGMEGIEKIWDSYEALLGQMEQTCMEGGSANEIAYTYLGYREPVADGLFDYICAYYSITDPSKLEDISESETVQADIGVTEETEGTGGEDDAD